MTKVRRIPERAFGRRGAGVVVSHGHEQQVRLLVEDIETREPGVLSPLVVVDNLAEGRLASLENRHPCVVVVEPPRRGGFGRNVNLGVRHIPEDVDFVAVLNPDLRIPRPVLAPVIERFRVGEWGLAAPILLDPRTGQRDGNARPFPSPPRIVAGGLRRWRARHGSGPPTAPSPEPLPTRPDWISGALMVLELEWFHRLGGFDEAFFMYGEDVDLCLRSAALGRPAVIVPDLWAHHAGARRSSRDARHLGYHLKSLGRLYRKHGWNGRRMKTR